MPELHETILSPDERGRFQLKRYLPRPVPERFLLFVSEDGKTLTLKAVEE